mmetsp:Transcript_39840/g.66255  ORF Transcript_39840/g.66255 Transcript_39840/m.66255 type:complete len:353 (+) Transcript_39840:185-1243(+)
MQSRSAGGPQSSARLSRPRAPGSCGVASGMSVDLKQLSDIRLVGNVVRQLTGEHPGQDALLPPPHECPQELHLLPANKVPERQVPGGPNHKPVVLQHGAWAGDGADPPVDGEWEQEAVGGLVPQNAAESLCRGLHSGVGGRREADLVRFGLGIEVPPLLVGLALGGEVVGLVVDDQLPVPREVFPRLTIRHDQDLGVRAARVLGVHIVHPQTRLDHPRPLARLLTQCLGRHQHEHLEGGIRLNLPQDVRQEHLRLPRTRRHLYHKRRLLADQTCHNVPLVVSQGPGIGVTRRSGRGNHGAEGVESQFVFREHVQTQEHIRRAQGFVAGGAGDHGGLAAATRPTVLRQIYTDL